MEGVEVSGRDGVVPATTFRAVPFPELRGYRSHKYILYPSRIQSILVEIHTLQGQITILRSSRVFGPMRNTFL